MRTPRNDRAEVETCSPAKTGAQGDAKQRSRAPGPRPSPGSSHAPERTCVLTRRKGSREQLIRLALGPDGTVAPDVRARASGRGAWIAVGREALAQAVSNGKLKTALQRAFKAGAVEVPPDLAERTEAALRQVALDRLGMEARAGNLINGSERVEAAARSGKVHLLVHAADASDDGRKKLDQAWRAGGGAARGVIIPADRTILSLALGRENVVHVALIEPAAAARVTQALARWREFIDPDAGLDGGDPAPGTGSAEEVEGTE